VWFVCVCIGGGGGGGDEVWERLNKVEGRLAKAAAIR